MKLRSLLLVAACAAFLVVGGAAPAPAVTSATGIAIHPKTGNWFTLNLARGEIYKSVVIVENHSKVRVTGWLYATDAFTTPQGGFGLNNIESRGSNVAEWVLLKARRMDLAPGGRREVPFTLTVPTFATPGDYAGGIVFQRDKSATTVSADHKTATNIIERVAARVYVSVAGVKQPSFVVTRVQRNGNRFDVTVKNNGNIRLRFDGTVSVKGMFSSVVKLPFTGPADLMNPGDLIKISVPWRRPGLFGSFHAEATVDYGQGMHASGSTGFWLIPWLLIAAILAGGALIVYLLRRGIRWVLRAKTAMQAAGNGANGGNGANSAFVRGDHVVTVNGVKRRASSRRTASDVSDVSDVADTSDGHRREAPGRPRRDGGQAKSGGGPAKSGTIRSAKPHAPAKKSAKKPARSR